MSRRCLIEVLSSRQLPILRFALNICNFAIVSCESERHAQSCLTLQRNGLYRAQNSPGQNTIVDSCSLLQGIFPNQGSNPGLPYYRQILYRLSHKISWVSCGMAKNFGKHQKYLMCCFFIFVYRFSNVLYKRNWINYHCVCCQF